MKNRMNYLKKIMLFGFLICNGIITLAQSNPLDNITSEGIYSLRKLKSTYTGPAIQVRRSNDNAIQDITFLIDGTLNTQQLKTFVGSNNIGYVAKWYDQSENNRHLQQTVLSIQPILIQTGVIRSINNKPCIFFDASRYLVATTAITANQIVAVYQLKNSTSSSFIFGSGTVNNNSFNIIELTSSNLQAGTTNELYNYTQSAAQQLSHKSVFVNANVANSNTQYLSGTPANNATGTATMCVGSQEGTLGARMYLQEFSWFNNGLTESQLNNLQQEAMDYYGMNAEPLALNTLSKPLLTAGNTCIAVAFATSLDDVGKVGTYEIELSNGSHYFSTTKTPFTIMQLPNGESVAARIRVNSALGTGPWSEFSDPVTPSVNTMPYNYENLKAIAIEVATAKYNTLVANNDASASVLQIEITALQNSVLPVPATPIMGDGFFPVPMIKDSTNPYYTATINSITDYLNVTTVTASAPLMRTLYWGLVAPESPYRYHPELFKRFLTNTFNFAYNGYSDYIWEASGISYAYMQSLFSFSNYIPLTIRNKIIQATSNTFDPGIPMDGDIWTNIYVPEASRQINVGIILEDTNLVSGAKHIINRVQNEMLYKDGAYAYLGDQNEVANYHYHMGHNLAEMYAITNLHSAYDIIQKASNWEIIDSEPGFVPEFYTAPWWKTQWNSMSGYSGDFLGYLAGNAQYVSLANQRNAIFGFDGSMLSYTYYKPITPKAIPQSFFTFDSNINGIKFRNGTFSYGITARKAIIPNMHGIATMVGAMTTEDANNKGQRRLKASVMQVNAMVQTGNNTNTFRFNRALLMPELITGVSLSKTIGGVSGKSRLYISTTGPIGQARNWETFQEWIALPNRMIGLVQLYPYNNSPAVGWATEVRVKLGYGRSATNPPGLSGVAEIETLSTNNHYRYKDIDVKVHGYDFESIFSEVAPTLQDQTYQARDLIFKTDLSGGNTTAYTYPANYKKYAIVEIRPSGITSDVQVSRVTENGVEGLIVNDGGNLYSVWRNTTSSSKTVTVSQGIVASKTTTVHFSRGDEPGPAPQNLTGTTITLSANEQRLLISSDKPLDHQPSWKNFDEVLDKAPAIEISTATPSVPFGTSITFASSINNVTNPNYQWYINNNPVMGANESTFTTNSITNGQEIRCDIAAPIADGTFLSATSNRINVTISNTPNNCTTGRPTAVLIPGAKKMCQGLGTSMSVRVTNGTGPFMVVYNNGSTNVTLNNYNSDTPIILNPLATTTFSLVNVISVANGCVGTVDTTPYTLTIDTGTSDTATYMGTSQTVNHDSFTSSEKFSDNATCASQFVKVIPASACPTQVIHQGIIYTTLYTTGQCWIKENIKAVPTQLPVATPWVNNIDTMWHGEQSGSSNAYYYQWSAAMNGSTQERAQGVCPTGFHIPSDCEWMFFEHNLGMSIQAQQEWDIRGGCNLHGFVAKKLLTPSLNGTTSLNMVAGYTGFRALSGNFNNTNDRYYVWTSSQQNGQAISRFIQNNANGVGRQPTAKGNAMQVRCIKD